MDPWKKNIISTNLAELIQDTECSEVLFANLSMFTKEEIGKLKTIAKSDGPFAASAKLYDLAQTRTEGFEALKTALDKSKQTGPLKILVDGENSYNASNSQAAQGAPIQLPATQPVNQMPVQMAGYEQLIVGDPPCTYEAVETTLSTCATANSIYTKLPEIVTALGLSTVVFNVAVVQFGVKNYPTLIQEILLGWRTKEVGNATLGKLISVLESKQLKDPADALRKRFSVIQ